MCGPRNGPEMPGHVLGCGHTPVSPAALPAGISFLSQLLHPSLGSIQAHGETALHAQTCLWEHNKTDHYCPMKRSHLMPVNNVVMKPDESLLVSWTRMEAKFSPSPLLFLSKCFSEPRSSFHLTFFLVLNSDKEQICNPKCYRNTSLGAGFTVPVNLGQC